MVIPTYQRLEQCRRAISSALEQERPPLEVIVCDDGSTDGTEEELRAWASREPSLQYLRLAENSGAPARVRNLGLRAARGEWVGFLDDDDQWIPSKLRVQGEAIGSGRYDLVASDAVRGSGGPYFGLDRAVEPDRAEFLRHNPIITSTAVVRRSTLLDAGGFADSAALMSITAAEDYAAWLNLADRGARFVILPEQLVIYEDTEHNRLSRGVARQETEVAAVRWGLWLRHPADRSVLRSSLHATVMGARHSMRAALERARSRRGGDT